VGRFFRPSSNPSQAHHREPRHDGDARCQKADFGSWTSQYVPFWEVALNLTIILPTPMGTEARSTAARNCYGVRANGRPRRAASCSASDNLQCGCSNTPPLPIGPGHPAPTKPPMLEASFLVAFAGGILSLLSPCSALLLPAFFAYAFTSRTELLGRTLLFLAGLCTVFIPLGLGASIVAALLLDYRDTTILVAGLMLIGFGVLEIFGGGFSFLPLSFTGRFQVGRSAASAYAAGVVYGVSGFCAGPLLGAVLTIAGTSTSPLVGAALLFTYALGTASPLFLIAWLWDRYQLGTKPWLRGRAVHIGPLRTHTTNLVAGVVFIAFGASFIVLQGASVLSGTYADLGLEDVGFELQAQVQTAVSRAPRGLLLGVLAVLVLLGTGLWVRRAKPN
jgi:cytochrome c biogenesis protein CcdA